MFYDFEDHQSFYHDVQINEHCEGDAVVALDSKAGEERVVNRLERTTKERVNNLKEVLEAVENEGLSGRQRRATTCSAPRTDSVLTITPSQATSSTGVTGRTVPRP